MLHVWVCVRSNDRFLSTEYNDIFDSVTAAQDEWRHLDSSSAESARVDTPTAREGVAVRRTTTYRTARVLQ